MATNQYGVLQKRWLTAFVLSLFVGVLGVDRFYLGKIGTGILKLLTFGGFGIWALIDFILIATKNVRGVEWVDDDKNDARNAWIIFGVAVALSVVVGATNAQRLQNTPTTDTTASTSNSVETTSKWDMESAYSKIENGMTKAQVEEVVGKKSQSCSESQDELVGKAELCTYGNAFVDPGVITVTFMQDQVSSKSKHTY